MPFSGTSADHPTPRVGVQLHPQHCDLGELRAAWRAADDLGADSIWVWDHFVPHTGDPEGRHYECWSLLSAMAVETRRAAIGSLVTCTAYRNPHLLADQARTVDLLSGGRLVLGVGAGWFEQEHLEYGYPFPGPGARIDAFEAAVTAIRERLGRLNPGPAGPLPLLIGGGGAKRTLAAVARFADLWNWYGWEAGDPVEEFRSRSRLLDEWCERVGRDPREIGRTVMIDAPQTGLAREFAAAGATEIIVSVPGPFDLAPLRELLGVRDASAAR
ncbi:5,10-methylene tetrahydromethanopterin reductase [Streptomyces incarnatus]|uniref:5,10-methylene tetrahydromethanopterin reductase n=1 Tax=Streptomyces incarnatus TaxID=665007 RepID=A0ABN4GCY7_9ACTN|nr:LLM class F420-dependent oxidoreductase [Streptomyces incarnatus]AKJ10264.1 5,10-methylene tetrahydromethanopterin reductase [Streptomyces incarnatus]